MQGIYTTIIYLIIFLQACFTALLAGQSLSLMLYRKPVSWVSYGAMGLVSALVLLFCYRKRVQVYLLKYVSFAWTHFSDLAYGLVLLVLLLPAFIHFEESAWIVYTFQLGSLTVVCLLLADQHLLQRELLQKVYTDLLQARKISPYLNFLIWVIAFAGFTLLSNQLFAGEAGSLAAILQHTFFAGLVLFVLLACCKIALFRGLCAPSAYKAVKADSVEEEESEYRPDRENYYDLEKNLKKILLESTAAERPQIYEKIRQIPLVDKIDEIDTIHHQYLPADQSLSHLLTSLKKLRNELPAGIGFNDIDRLRNVIAVKACIRTVIREGNPMLVQKFLTDNRPEVRKAAMLATVYFREASFIPALVNLLKDDTFSFTAKEALREWGDQCIPFLRSAIYRNKNNSFFIEQCIDLVESYKSAEARDFLLEMLNEQQKHLQYKAALALLNSNYALSALHKTQILHFIEGLMGTIALLRGIRCRLQDDESNLFHALLEEEKEKKAIMLDLLQAFLPSEVWNKLMKTLEAPDSLPATRCALVDLFFPLLLRNKCKILLAAEEHEDVGPALQAEYLQEQVWHHYTSEHEAIRQVLKLDFGRIGCWLRLCALKHLATMPGQQASLHLLGEMFNKNPLLQETAAEVLYVLNHDYYYLYMQRLPTERAKLLRYKIESRMAPVKGPGQADAHLLYDQIHFLRSLPLFAACSYERLAGMLKFFSISTLEPAGGFLQADPYQPVGYWIIFQGAFTVFHRGERMFQAEKGDVIDMSFLADAEDYTVSVRAEGEIKFYFIEKVTLNNLYLKSDYFNKRVFQPGVNQSAELLAT